MRVALTIRTLVLFYLLYLLVFLASDYEPGSPSYSPPFVIFVIDTINLFIHEAGHLFLKPFGMWLHLIGGSFFQCFLPLVLLIVTWRQNRWQVAFPGFWLGENLVNVSAYIKDAPYRQLKLISKGAIHDWNWLLSGNLDVAEPLGTGVFLLGSMICGGAIAAGLYFTARGFREADS